MARAPQHSTIMDAMTATAITITHRAEGQCFEATVQGQRCVLDYRITGSVVHLTHTYVPPSLEGQGIAAQLVEAGLQWVQAQGMKVTPACSYARLYIQRHAQWQALLA